jgi:hypothetical protein
MRTGLSNGHGMSSARSVNRPCCGGEKFETQVEMAGTVETGHLLFIGPDADSEWRVCLGSPFDPRVAVATVQSRHS